MKILSTISLSLALLLSILATFVFLCFGADKPGWWEGPDPYLVSLALFFGSTACYGLSFFFLMRDEDLL